jgi:tryptophanyl-tRNA synthetase
MLKTNLMSGLRLSPCGLHLGHYLGCLTPLNQFKNNDKLYFVIRDKGVDVFNTSSQNYKNLIDILIDLSSTQYSDRIVFVLQSKLKPYYSPIVSFLQNVITTKQLGNFHPHRKKIKTNSYNMSVSDFLFPLESISTYYILNADRILMNDDNLSVVKFAYSTNKKLTYMFGKNIFTNPILVHGVIPRLLGYNYEKVSKSNKNAIFFSDERDILEQKLCKILSFKYLFRLNPKLSIERSELRDNFILPDSYLPFNYLRVFSNENNIEKKIQQYKSFNNYDLLKSDFINTMRNFIFTIQEKRNSIKDNKKILIDKLYNDTSSAEVIAKQILEQFMATLK